MEMNEANEAIMKLNNLHPAPGSKKPRRRVGRGIGSGLGKTAGRGHKGQKSRAGGFHKAGFEGGQMPLYRRLPKRGFTVHNRKIVKDLPMSVLEFFEAGSVINVLTLQDRRLVKKNIDVVKIIMKGELTKAVKLEGIQVTQSVKLAIEAAGGSVS